MNQKSLETQRKRRLRTNNASTKKYEKTKKGFLMRVYRNMKSRVEGIQKLKSHLYEGKEILDKQSFYDFSLNDENFNNLFNNWEDNNYDRKICPSIDRKDSSKGYFLENMRWITHSKNSKLGNLSRYDKLK